mgnify:FL=1
MKKLLPIILAFMLMLAGCGKGDAVASDKPAPEGTQTAADDKLDIGSFALGEHMGTVDTETENGETRYIIRLTLPSDFDFKRAVANIELAEGASIDTASPCIVDDIGGRPVLNLTLEPRSLMVRNGNAVRSYEFDIGLE